MIMVVYHARHHTKSPQPMEAKKDTPLMTLCKYIASEGPERGQSVILINFDNPL